MAAAIVIAAMLVEGPAGNPGRTRMRRPTPITGDPDVVPAPIPEAIDPHVAGSRGVADNTNYGGRGRRSHIISSLRGATDQREHGQRGYQQNRSFHSALLRLQTPGTLYELPASCAVNEKKRSSSAGRGGADHTCRTSSLLAASE